MNAKQQFLAANLRPGELYAGLMLGVYGWDYHLILLPNEASSVTWEEAQQWAEAQGGSLPIRREQALLYANLQHEFESGWYWSGEQHEVCPDEAWGRGFGNYHEQHYTSKQKRLSARAVRRIYIEQEGE